MFNKFDEKGSGGALWNFLAYVPLRFSRIYKKIMHKVLSSLTKSLV